MKRFSRKIFLIIITLLMTIALLGMMTTPVNADDKDKSGRGVPMEMSFDGGNIMDYLDVHQRTEDMGGSLYLEDYLADFILCAQHGMGIPLSETDNSAPYPDSRPRVLVHVEIDGDYDVDEDVPDEEGYDYWEFAKEWSKTVWTWKDHEGAVTDAPEITLSIKRLKHLTDFGLPDQPAIEPSEDEQTDSEDVKTGYIYTNTYSHYDLIQHCEWENNAISYLYAECVKDGGKFPSASYINVASWLLQDNPNATENMDVTYFVGEDPGDQASHENTLWMYQEQLETLEERLKKEKGKPASQKDEELIHSLENNIDALKQIINDLTTSGPQDGVSNVEARVARVAADVYEEAIIFGRMWEILNSDEYKGSYANTIKDRTQEVAGDDFENLHVQFHTETDGEFDTYYIVGPFKFDYLEFYTPIVEDGGVKKGGQLCGMTGVPELYVRKEGNSDPVKLTYNTDYKFEYTKDDDDGVSNGFKEDQFEHYRREFPNIPDQFHNIGYPHSGETFYLKIKYQEGIQEILKMKFEFRYMTAKCKYDRYAGWLYTTRWHAEANSYYCSKGYELCSGNEKHDTSTFHKTGEDEDGNPTGYYCTAGHKCKHGFWEDHYYQVDVGTKVEDNNTNQDIQDCIVVDSGDRGYGSDDDGDGTTEDNNVVKEFEWEVDLTTTVSGWVWNDRDPDKAGGGQLGVWEKGEEKGLRNAEVNVYLYSSDTMERVPTSYSEEGLATIYDSNWNRVEFPLYTDANGEWNHEKYRFEAPGVQQHLFYVVEFQYDGQYFKDTFFLSNGESNVYVSAEQTADKAYDDDMNLSSAERSKAVTEVIKRKEFDQSFGVITGDSSMSSGHTDGYTLTTTIDGEEVTATSSGSDSSVKYDTAESNDITNPEGQSDTLVISRLDEPMDENGGDEKQQQMFTDKDNYDRYRLKAITYYNKYVDGKSSNGESATDGLMNPDNYRIKYPKNKIYFMDKIKNEGGKKDGPRYADEYMRHINLGVTERKETDLSLTKDLYKVTLVVNEQKVVYKFNPYSLTTENYVELEAKLERLKTSEGNYTLGLYESDVGYNSKNRYANALERIVGTQNAAGEFNNDGLKSNTELRLFASYVIRAYNNSETEDAVFNEIADYIDDEMTLVQNGENYSLDSNGFLKASIINDQMKRESTTIAEAPYYRVCNAGDFNTYNWGATKEDNIAGFKEDKTANFEEGSAIWGNLTWDHKEGNKYTTTTLREPTGSLLKLTNNEYVEIFTTYEIDKAGYDYVSTHNMTADEAISYRQQHLLRDAGHVNTAEIVSYSTFYGANNIYRNHVVGEIAGRVDKDSAPNNIEYKNYGTYEDDTYEAPRLLFKVETKTREIEGVVFEDAKTEGLDVTSVDFETGETGASSKTTNIKVGDGKYEDSTDKGVDGVQVSLYEVINLGSLDQNEYSEYAGLEYYYKVDGFDTETKDGGKYLIDGFLSGDYVVRFDYGTKTDTPNQTIYTAEHPDADGETVDIVKYNGQDYENTRFLGEFLGSGEDTKLNMKFLPVDGKDDDILMNQDVSKARDNESRRLEVIGFSRTIENERGEMLRDRIDDEDGEYIENTRMFAETPIIRAEVEDPSQLNKEPENMGADNKGNKEPDNPNQSTTIMVYEYGGEEDVSERQKLEEVKVELKKINFGIEERARTDIELKNRITEIRVTKAGDEIFKVTVNDDGTMDYTADTVRARKLTAMPTSYRAGNNIQGFFAVEIEAEYLNGLNIQTTYKTEVINNSEIDFTGRVSGVYREAALDAYARNIPTSQEYEDIYRDYQKKLNETLSEDDVDLSTVYRLNTNATKEVYNLANINGDNLSKNMGGQIKSSQATDTIKPEVIIYGMFTGRYYYENKIYNQEGSIGDKYKIADYVRDVAVLPIEVKYDRDYIVRTTVNQLVNYVDVDADFRVPNAGIAENSSWETIGEGDTTDDQISYGAHNEIVYTGGYEPFESLISDASYRQATILGATDLDFFDNKDRKYITNGSSNIGFSINESLEKMEKNNRQQYTKNDVRDKHNPKLTRQLEPLQYVYPDFITAQDKSEDAEKYYQLVSEEYKNRFLGEISVRTIKTTTSSESAGDINLDNLAEILVYSNPTGRRDQYSVPGNALAIGACQNRLGNNEMNVWYDGYNSIRNGAYGRTAYKALNSVSGSARSDENRVINETARQWTLYPEDDQWSPEYISVIPPTGIAVRTFIKNNLPILIASILAVIALAIIFIRKQIKIKHNK